MASTKETNLWRYLKEGMGNRWDACRHEDKITEGVPDVSFGMSRIDNRCLDRKARVNGWIELKVLDSWPKRPSTVVRVDHLTDEQRRWIAERGKAGGNVWLFLRVGREYLLFYWDVVNLIGTRNAEDLKDLASRTWEGSVDWEDFESALYNVPLYRTIA